MENKPLIIKNIDQQSLLESFIVKGFYGWQKTSFHILDGKVYRAFTMKRHDKTISCIATLGRLEGRDVFVSDFNGEKIYGPKYLNKKATEKNIVEIHDEFIERNFKQTAE